LAQTAAASRGDPAVLVAAGLSSAALVGAVQTPIVGHFFGARPLGPIGWGIVMSAATTAAVIGAIPLRWMPWPRGTADQSSPALDGHSVLA
jgi:cation-transporting ATPase I